MSLGRNNVFKFTVTGTPMIRTFSHRAVTDTALALRLPNRFMLALTCCCASRKTRGALTHSTTTVLLSMTSDSFSFLSACPPVFVRRTPPPIDRWARAAQENPSKYMHYVVGDYESYVGTMAKNYEYGTELEAAALAERLGRPIRIWQGYPKARRGSRLACRYI